MSAENSKPDDDKTDIVICGRRLGACTIEGLTALEVSACAQIVDERMRQISAQQKGAKHPIADSSKLALLTALDIAADYLKAKTRLDELDREDEKRLDKIILSLQSSREGP